MDYHDHMKLEKLLIISNASMSQSDSNGRNLARLTAFLSPSQKAQFFVYGTPDFDECFDYYRVTDSMALSSFLTRKKQSGVYTRELANKQNETQKKKKNKKTPFRMILRETVWKFGCWKNTFLDKWIESINPDCLLVVCGDNAFTLDLARRIASKKGLPIILYSTEEYPFKEYNYVTKRPSLFYKILKRIIEKAYKRIEKYVKAAVFNTIPLRDLFASKYSYKCHYIYQSSNIDWIESKPKIAERPRISYLGNLGLNRHKALIDIAKVLSLIDSTLTLDIYGNVPEEAKKEFEEYPNICLRGFVSYNKVVEIIHESSLLVHAEYNDGFYNRDLRYAFSTKISDCVCSGTPLLIYAFQGLAETTFLKEQKCAFVATNKGELLVEMNRALYDQQSREEVLKEALRTRKTFFTKNSAFREIIEGITDE